MKPMKIITFVELKRLNDEGRILDFESSGKDKVYIKALDGWRTQPCLIENVAYETVGRHLAVSDGSERTFLKFPTWIYKNQGLLVLLVISMTITTWLGPSKSKDRR